MSYKHFLGGIIGISSMGYLLFRKNSIISNNAPLSDLSNPIPSILQNNHQLTTELKLNPAGFFQFGFPGPFHDIETHENFITCYDRRTKNPYWVVEHITADSLKCKNANRKHSIFKENEKIPEMFRNHLKDYFRSGYDRGHMVPAADANFSQTAMDKTFYLTNVCPQVGDGFNKDYWARFEKYCRETAKIYGNIYVVTGPLYLPKKDPFDGKYRVTYEVIGNPPNVAVPTHFFKLIIVNGNQVLASAFVMPNQSIDESTKLSEFQVPVNALERATGLQFLSKVNYKQLPVNDKLMPLLLK